MKDSGRSVSEFIIEHMTEPIVILDKKGLITFANPAVKHLYGVQSKDIIGKDFFDLVDPTDVSRIKKAYTTLIKNPSSSIVISHRFLPAIGKTISVESTFKNLIDDQHIQGILLSIRDMTDTKKIEQQLLDAQKELKRTVDDVTFITENNLDVIFQIKATGEFTFMNAASKRIAGYDPKEMIGTNWMNYVPKKELIRYISKMKRVLSGEKIDDFQTFVIHKDGHLVPVEFSGNLVKKEKKLFINGTMRDLSNRIESKKQLDDLAKSLEEQVQEQKKEYEYAFKKLHDQEEMFETLFNNLPDAVLLTDEEHVEIVQINKKMASGFGQAPKDLLGKKCKELLPESLYQERLRVGKKALETNTIQIRFDKRGKLHLQTLYIPLKLSNGKRYEYVIARDITELRNQEVLAKEHEEKYRILFEHASEAIAVVQDGYFKLINPKLIQMIGQTEEEILSTPFIQLIHPDDKELVASRYQLRLSGKQPPSDYDFRVIDTFGSVHWVRINAVLFQWDGKPATLNFIVDITERKNAEDSLKKSEMRFKTFFNSSSDAIFIHDPKDMSIVDVNEEACRRFGFTREEMKMVSVEDISDTSMLALFTKKNEYISKILSGETITIEFLSKNKKGKTFWHEMKLNLIDVDGEKRILATARDIQSRKQLEEKLTNAYNDLELRIIERTAELKESEKRYRDLFELAPIGIGISDKKGHIIDANKNMIQIMGFSDLQDIQKVNLKDLYVNKLDRKRLLMDLQASGRVRDWLVELKRKKGDTYYALLDIDTLYIGNRNVLFTTARDITELLRIQKQAAETRDFLRNIIDSASEFIMTLDVDLTVTMWNKTAVDLTGYTRKETVGTSIKTCICFENASAIVDYIRNIREGRSSVLDTIVIHPKTTGKRVLALSHSIIRDEKNDIIGFLFVGRDITAQSTLHGKLLQGNSYLILDESVRQSIDLFVSLQMSGYHGLLFSRGNPVSLKNSLSSLPATMFLFDEHQQQDVQTIVSLDDVYTRLQQFVVTHDPSVVLLDRLDYLMTIHSYKEVLEMIYKINSLISSHHAILLIRMNASLLSHADLELLQQEVRMLPAQKMDAIELDETLYNILVFVYEQHQKNVSVSFQKVGKEFSISKVTTQKRIYDLEQQGILGVRIKGRMKLVYVTKEGEILLHQRKAV